MKFFTTLVIALGVASSTFAANCKTVKSPYAANTTITIKPNQTGNAASKAAGFQASIIGSIQLIDDCTFKVVSLDTSGIAIPSSAKVEIWGGPDHTLTSDGYPIVDKTNVVTTTGSVFSGTFSLDPLAQTQDTVVGASFADFKQFRFYSEQYSLFLAYADLPTVDASGNTIVTNGTGNSTSGAAIANAKIGMTAVAGAALGMAVLL